MNIKILKKAKTYIIVHKPAGYVVYSDSKEDNKISCQVLLEKQLSQKIYPVHRIDKPTCGVLIYALTQQKANQLSTLFKTKRVDKTYLAFCHGEMVAKARADFPLKKHKEKLTELAATNLLNLETIEIDAKNEKRKYSLVEAIPETGRYHQIRRHLKMMKCPIVGDPVYGNSWNNDFFKEKYNINRTLLSAVSISFVDPETKEKVFVKTAPDQDFSNLLNKLGIKVNI
ncbi:MAG: pseudouridine synthase [Bdellovibrionota bacterium]